jgi:hypothetical protein
MMIIRQYFPRLWYDPYQLHVRGLGLCPFFLFLFSFFSELVCDLLPRNQWACTRLLVGKLGHTGLVPFVDEFGTVCGEVPLEYGFAVIV